ncbi:class E sortase [Streptomyces sp. NPDC006879]|uniref:class E sortase n=1 Tax=Streptomyces sp. NPDC006879 TaxID=3364767 RepID=UPI0036A093AE
MRSRRSSAPRLIVRTFSEVCLTVGTLIVLFVAYLLLWTGVRAEQSMTAELERLRDRWPTGPAAAPGTARRAPSEPPPGGEAYPPGRPFAEMHIPRFGTHWTKPVLQGTGADVLKRGLGHYPGSGQLGVEGNFAVAGHRRTHGDPFKDFPRLRPGDAVVLNDGVTWFTYRVANRPLRITPQEVDVLDPVPAKSGFRAPGKYLTLTTCEPEWGHSHRLVVWARLTAADPVTAGRPSVLRS